MPSVRERLRAGEDPLSGFVNLIPSPVATQALAAAGADVVWIDEDSSTRLRTLQCFFATSACLAAPGSWRRP